MKQYVEKQLRLIHLFAQQQNLDDEAAVKVWIETGLAERFNKMFGDLYNEAL